MNNRTVFGIGAGLIAVVLAVPPQLHAADKGDDTAGSSAEYGQIHLPDTFSSPDAESEKPLKESALSSTTYDIHLRTFYFDRDKFDDSESQAWAAGGWVGLKTGYFGNRAAFGATVYGSYPVDAPDDKDGTGLLAPGQEGYTVLGELYADIKLTEAVHAYAGRKEYDTPYINRSDIRMTPNTFEAFSITGTTKDNDGANWRFGAGYFDEIKTRNSDEFISMSRVLGADVERGVYAAGLNYERGNFSLGAIDYYSDDVINIFYTEARFGIPLADNRKLKFAAQYSDQSSVGDELFMGDFSGSQFGLKGEYGIGPALFTIAYTSTDDGADMQSVWGSYPGYTFAQVEAFNRAGEDALLLRASYNFQSIPGLSAYALWIDGSDPVDSAEFARDEIDLNLQWKANKGKLKGLAIRFRYAHIDQDDPDNSDTDDFRVIVDYAVPI